jgi:hypothetical protein
MKNVKGTKCPLCAVALFIPETMYGKCRISTLLLMCVRTMKLRGEKQGTHRPVYKQAPCSGCGGLAAF